MIKGALAITLVIGALLFIGCTTPTEYVCGNDVCDPTESQTTCPADCAAGGPICGNGGCDGTETCATCAEDCGTCPLIAYCGDGTCDDDETCATCESDCGSCPASGKDELMSFMNEVYDERISTGTSYSDGREITFDVGDDVVGSDVARMLGLYSNRVTMTCAYGLVNMAPDASLGCVDFEGITPTGASTAYVYASCVGDNIQCTVDFQKA